MLVLVRYIGLRCARNVRISYKVPRDYDLAVAVAAVAADTVVATDAANTALLTDGSVGVTTIYRRYHLYRFDDPRSPPLTSLVPPKPSSQGISVRTILSRVKHSTLTMACSNSTRENRTLVQILNA